MKVSELIDELSKHNPNADVVTRSYVEGADPDGDIVIDRSDRVLVTPRGVVSIEGRSLR